MRVYARIVVYIVFKFKSRDRFPITAYIVANTPRFHKNVPGFTLMHDACVVAVQECNARYDA